MTVSLFWGKRMVLANTAIFISENFASSIEHRRKLLYPIMKKAKALDKHQQAYLKSDKFVLNNVEYSLTDGSFRDLPTDLNSTHFQILSRASPYKDITHDTLEHAYQYAKAYSSTVIVSMTMRLVQLKRLSCVLRPQLKPSKLASVLGTLNMLTGIRARRRSCWICYV